MTLHAGMNCDCGGHGLALSRGVEIDRLRVVLNIIATRFELTADEMQAVAHNALSDNKEVE